MTKRFGLVVANQRAVLSRTRQVKGVVGTTAARSPMTRGGIERDPFRSDVREEGTLFGLRGLGEGTVPYPWPFDGTFDVAHVALVVAGADRWWTNHCVDLAAARAAVERTAVMVRRYGAHVVFLCHGRPLDALLRGWGCTHLAMAGFGLEGPVHSTLRSANDRGYERLLLADACGPVGKETRRGALSTVTMSGPAGMSTRWAMTSP